jgi:hypothetical protein
MSIDRTPRLLGTAALAAGLLAWAWYLQQDLVLSHYDAKAHLVVARRIFDSLTPGWKQIGAVWLPLPHLVQAIPTQIDLFYRTGAFGSLLSIGCLATTVWAFARLVLSITGSRLGSLTSTALLLANPNLLYLHVTPMTEPLLLATTALVVLWTYEWLQSGSEMAPGRLHAALVAAAWTRYEAWAVIGAVGMVAAYVLWRQGPAAGRLKAAPVSAMAAPTSVVVAWRTGRLLIWPVVAVLLFLVLSRLTVGAWFVSGGFYVPDPRYQGHPVEDVIGVWWGGYRLSGLVIETLALGTSLVVAWRGVTRRRDAALLVPLALLAAAALPFYAMFEGHPYRIRYMVPMAAACALLCGLAVGMIGPTEDGPHNRPGPDDRPRRRRRVVAIAILAAALVEVPPWSRDAVLLEEAQWDVPVSAERGAVRACLARDYRGEKVLASMGSLAHLMQELAHHGFAIADFIHEGNGSIWAMALETGPAPHAGWMLVEERSEGGDVLARLVQRDPSFVRGMTRVCEGGGVALYRKAT